VLSKLLGRRAVARFAPPLLAGTLLLGGGGGPAQAKPTAVVAMGDSAISGESAGDYEPGTDQPGNFCHRSRRALVHQTTIPAVDVRLNLSCSGARSEHLRIGGPGQNGEPSQSQKLRTVAATHDVKAIVVEIGTNDDPRFGDTAAECIAAFVLSVPGGCRSTAGPTWPQRLARMVPKVEAALDDVRAIMDQVDPQATWQPILLSYWSPVPRPPIRYSGYFSKIWHGCPIANADMAWGHDTAVPQLNEALRGVAERKGWRFLDLSRSMDGREICATGITHAQEWITGFKYDASSADPLSFDAVRQSLHANAAGHVQLGRCLTQFAAQPQREGLCLRGSNGALQAMPQ
jgi:lysophospholipase L1-like esterase